MSESHSVVSDSLQPHGLYTPWNSPGQNPGMGGLSLLQGIFPSQGSNPGLPGIPYQLSHKGSSGILEWVAYPFPGDLPDPGIEPGSPTLQVDSWPTELSGSSTFLQMTIFHSFLWLSNIPLCINHIFFSYSGRVVGLLPCLGRCK